MDERFAPQPYDKANRSTDQSADRIAALAALGQLSGQLAHDLNNMLAVILASVEIASKIDDIAKIREFLDTTIKMIGLQRELTDNMARASRACESPELVDVHSAIEQSIAELGARAGSAVEVSLRLDAERHLIRCDAKFLRDAVRNVATNACAAMPDGGRLSISTRNASGADLPTKTAYEYLMLTVADSGDRMSDDARHKAFDLFFRSNDGTGLGLGLAQARDTVRRAGGFATVDSEAGSGSTITLGFPLASDGGIDP